MDAGDFMIIIYVFCLLGWIPILAIGKAISMVIYAFKSSPYDYEETTTTIEEDEEDDSNKG